MNDYLNTDIVHVPELTMTKEQFMKVYERYFGTPSMTRSELVSEGNETVKITNSKTKKMGSIRNIVREVLGRRSDKYMEEGMGPKQENALYGGNEKLSLKAMEVRRISKIGGLNISRYDINELMAGYEVEKEHGTVNPNTNVTNDDEVKTLKIAIAHLNEVPDYYTKLAKYVENKKLDEAKKRNKANPWAVCTSKVGRSDKDKYERCVMGVKKGQGMHEEAEEIDEKSVSKKQQKFMGQVHAIQTGQIEPSDINPKFRKNIMKVAKTMKPRDAEDFAKTKHKGLPEKKKSINECGYPHSNNGKSRLVVKQSADNIDANKIETTKKFIIACLRELGIKEPVSVFLTGTRGGPIKTTASFDPDNNDIWVYTKNRNMLGDVLRSIAHEIRHLKQNLDGVITDESGKDGSQHENEANSFSGLMIRKFGRDNPVIYQ
jgi:hypothetical protein